MTAEDAEEAAPIHAIAAWIGAEACVGRMGGVVAT